MVVLSITTTLVFLFPLVRLAPSWLERPLNRRLAYHRAAVKALAEAILRSQGEPAQLARLNAQCDYHCAALARLLPDNPVAAGKAKTELDSAA